jgi:hypothetical protein
VPAGTPGKNFSFDSIVDGAVIGFGDLICSSQTSIQTPPPAILVGGVVFVCDTVKSDRRFANS